MISDSDRMYMALALEQARRAAHENEVPVGAVVVKNGVVIGVGHNSCIATSDPTAHAEANAMRQAARHLSNYRLESCTLYVTVEPCAMCAGAILNARVKRVVFGAHEPKTGAGGSVLNLFDIPVLNHQTEIEGGVLAAECRELIQFFFEQRRTNLRSSTARLREDALRTPDICFEQLGGYPWKPRYLQDLAVLSGLRMHYVDEGPGDASTVFVCLHSHTNWSYFFRDLIPIWVQAGCRVVAPDLIGFGKSDKPKRKEAHNLEFHAQYLSDWIERMDLHNIVLVVHEEAYPLGRMLPLRSATRYRGFLVLEAAKHPIVAPCAKNAYTAPFPDSGHRAGVTFFSNLYRSGLTESPNVCQFWDTEWSGVSQRVSTMTTPHSTKVQEIDPAVALAVLSTFTSP